MTRKNFNLDQDLKLYIIFIFLFSKWTNGTCATAMQFAVGKPDLVDLIT